MKRIVFLALSAIASLLCAAEAAWAATSDPALNFDISSQPAPLVAPTSPPPPAVAPPPPPAPPERDVAVPRSPDPLAFPSAASAPPPPPATALRPTPEFAAPAPASPAPAPRAEPAPDLERLFAGGPESLVARTVGHAEGTRTADGGKTRAYAGHTDPGNGVWNLGSFSFQHCNEPKYNCSTPAEADQHQLRRLRWQAEQLRQRASALGLTLSLEEELNGIDLANQAPLAALGDIEAYPEHLARAKRMGLTGQDAILEGRVWGYWNPRTQRWNAPGLGNTEANIRHDQNRRMQAIARALQSYQQQLARRETTANRIIAQDRPR